MADVLDERQRLLVKAVARTSYAFAQGWHFAAADSMVRTGPLTHRWTRPLKVVPSLPAEQPRDDGAEETARLTATVVECRWH